MKCLFTANKKKNVGGTNSEASFSSPHNCRLADTWIETFCTSLFRFQSIFMIFGLQSQHQPHAFECMKSHLVRKVATTLIRLISNEKKNLSQNLENILLFDILENE